MFSVILSMILVSASEAGMIKGVWAQVALVGGAIIYGWALMANLGGEGVLWILHPVFLAVLWSILNILLTFILSFVYLGVPLRTLKRDLWLPLVLFFFLSTVLFYLGNFLNSKMQQIK